MTRVIGLLSFWDESPTWLAATIASMARVCDHVVVMDGRYALYPDKRLQSGSHEHYAVIDAARGAGLGITLHTAPHVYHDEMEKRTALFRLASAESTPFEDWYFIIDGDELLVECPHKDDVHAYLTDAAERGVHVVTAKFWEKTDSHGDEQRAEISLKLPVEWRYECASPRFWRVIDNMRVVGYHYNYLGENEAGETLELWGGDEYVKDRAKWDSLCATVVIENRNRLRGMQRDRDRQRYYKDRDDCVAETLAPLAVLMEGADNGSKV